MLQASELRQRRMDREGNKGEPCLNKVSKGCKVIPHTLHPLKNTL